MTVPLLRDLIDDAGLFPPARLPMAAAVARHRADRARGHPMLTHRFLCPASRWDELLACLDPADRLRVGLILDAPAPDTAGARCVVEQAEIAVRPGDDLPSGLPWPVYVEPVRGPGWLDLVPELANRGLGAKVRCGGLTAQAFPAPADLVAFFRACVAADVPVKATAGLHHALPYTDQQTGLRHYGYLNVLLAVARTVEGAPAAEVDAAVSDPHPVAAIKQLPADLVTRTRRVLVSYGSCDTADPIADAVALGLAEGIGHDLARG
ncbi:MAG TPA: hypothetical protein VFH03_13885 [Actinoplanes sp.]|nr:hypothetical protein [Actinoplanes sp.]